MSKDAYVHFSDHSLLLKAQEAAYLGNNFNHTVNIRLEVIQRSVDVKRTWMNLRADWKDHSANRKWQLLMYDAVLGSRLEAVHLTKTLMQNIDAFHHKGLCKILRVASTYVDRRHTHQCKIV